MRRRRPLLPASSWLAALVCVASATGLDAQSSSRLEVGGPSTERLQVAYDRGWAAVAAESLARLGLAVDIDADTAWLRMGEATVRLTARSPFVSVGTDIVHLTDAPYWDRGRLMVPAQVLSEVLPGRSGGRIVYDAESDRVTTTEAPAAAAGSAIARSTAAAARRVVIIDAGHGGYDPGTSSPDGVQEKSVALSVALAFARALEHDPTYEVVLVRSKDVLVPVWKRGEQATGAKGVRPGVFVSLHANALPASRATRGFETYVLSDARTEHERRVAALENAVAENDGPAGNDSELGVILNELSNMDHQHWSGLLAEIVQEQLADAHSGPSRGVKQAPLAVLTNALMPAVLVELGYLTNPQDARLLDSREFHAAAGEALAEAVRRFFERYPGGSREALHE